MIFVAEYVMELKNGKTGKRKGPIRIPDMDLPTLIVEPLFDTKTKTYSATQCLIYSPNIGTRIVDYNLLELQALVEGNSNKQEVKGFKK